MAWADLPELVAIERAEVKRLRALLDRILNCGERRCWLCDQCLAAARDVDRPIPATAPVVVAAVARPPQTDDEREAFFRDLQRPHEVTERIA